MGVLRAIQTGRRKNKGERVRRRGLFLLCALATAWGGFLTGCAEEDGKLTMRAPVFEAGRIRLALSEAAALEEISVYRRGAVLLLRRRLASRRGREIRLDLPWKGGETYTFHLRTRDRGSVRQRVRAPVRDPGPFSVRLEIPHGLASPRTILPKGAAVRATLSVTAGRAEAGAFLVRMRLPRRVRLREPPPGFQRAASGNGETVLTARGSVAAADEVWFRQLSLRLPPGGRAPLRFSAEVRPAIPGAVPAGRAQVEVIPLDAAEIGRWIEVEKVRLPTDRDGGYNLRQAADTLLLPGGAWEFLRSMLGRAGPPPNPFVPYAHQTVWLRNRSRASIPLAVGARIRPRNGTADASFLQAPDLVSGGRGESIALAVLPPGRSTPVVLPVYLDPRKAEAGTYLRRIAIRLWGTETELQAIERPLHIRQPGLRPFFATLASLGVALAGVLFLAWRGFGRMNAMPLRLLCGAATFAAALFVLLALPELLLGGFLRAVSGPFAFLFTGLFTDIPLYALGTAYLMRYPLPGALGLLVLIRWMLLGVTLFSFHLIPILLVGMEVLALEGAAWLAGITRGPQEARLFQQWPARRWHPLLMAGASFAAADVLITLASFYLHMFFLRLEFAGWYILLDLAVSSVLYTFAGVAVGLRLGAPLREVAG